MAVPDLDPPRILRELERAGPGTVLLATDRVRATPPRARVQLLRTAPVPTVLLRGWVPLSELGVLEQRADLRHGGVDSSGCWWTEDGGPFRLWDAEGLRWALDDGELRRTAPPQRWSAEEIASVEAFVSRDWVIQGVRLRLADDRTVEVREHRNGSVLADFTYDGIDLDWDTSWCRRLARHLADGLGLPWKNLT